MYATAPLVPDKAWLVPDDVSQHDDGKVDEEFDCGAPSETSRGGGGRGAASTAGGGPMVRLPSDTKPPPSPAAPLVAADPFAAPRSGAPAKNFWRQCSQQK